MSYLYETADGQGFFIYRNQNEIILRKKEGHQFYLPVIMVRDYRRGLQDTVYNSAIYYTYINEKEAIVVRSVLEYVFPFVRQAGEKVSYDWPRLVAFYGRLLLFYIEKDTSEDEPRYHVRGILPYEEEHEIFNVDLKNEKPDYKIVSLSDRLLVSIENESGYMLYELSKDMQMTANGRIQSAKHDSTDNAATENAQLDMLRSNILKQQKEIEFYRSQIESAKKQYQELMEVAEKYRDEANHWSRKFN